jgi:hypothetical protein
MKKILLFAVVVSLSAPAAPAFAQAIHEGEWTMTVTTKVAGMEEEMAAAMDGMSEEEKAMMAQMMGGMMNMADGGLTTTHTQCITNDDPVPVANDDEDCTITHQKSGNTVTFSSVCPSGSSNGSVSYDGDSMEGTINAEADGEQVTIEISGTYVGPCTQ